jgi:hypothetical protein
LEAMETHDIPFKKKKKKKSKAIPVTGREGP